MHSTPAPWARGYRTSLRASWKILLHARDDDSGTSVIENDALPVKRWHQHCWLFEVQLTQEVGLMKRLLGGLCAFALITALASGCTESPSGRSSERPSTSPSASPSTAPPPASSSSDSSSGSSSPSSTPSSPSSPSGSGSK